MDSVQAPSYRGYRFPPEVISHCVWLYHRFSLSLRDIQELMPEHGTDVTCETIHQWPKTFGPRLRGSSPPPSPQPG